VTVLAVAQKFLVSEFVRERLTVIADNALGLVETNTLGPNNIRNTVHAILLIESHGQRGSALLNMTVEEWDGRLQTADKITTVETVIAASEVIEVIEAWANARSERHLATTCKWRFKTPHVVY
jgi:hypothetical protein